MRSFAYDLRQSLRALVRGGRFSVLAVLLLGLGIGSTAGIFAVFDALLLRQLPVPEPDSLVRLVQQKVRLGVRSDFRLAVYNALAKHSTTLESVTAATQLNAGYRDEGRAERVRLEAATASYFQLFGARAVLGRTLRPDDERPGATEMPAVLSYGFWQGRYGGRRDVIGRKILLQGLPFVIAGVADGDFHGSTVETSADVWVPVTAIEVLVPDRELREDYTSYEICGRLRPDVPLARARDESYSLMRAAVESAAAGNAERAAAVRNYELAGEFRLERIPRGVSRLREQISGALRFLMAAGAVLFLMAATSVAGLLLARFAARRQDLHTRMALGASPLRLARMVVFESLALTLCGGALGLLLAGGVAAVAPRLLPPLRLLDATTMPIRLHIPVDWPVLAVVFCGMLATALLTSLGPVVRILRTDPAPAMRANRGSTRAGGRSALVAVQVGLCTALLVVAAQLVWTLGNLRDLNNGFTRDTVLSFVVDLNLVGKDAGLLQNRLETWKDRVKELPGVKIACLASRPLLHGTGIKTTVAPAGERVPRSDFLNSSVQSASIEYFDTLGIHVVAGRNFQPREFESGVPKKGDLAPRVVNEAFVRRFFPRGDAIGQRFGIGVDVVVKPEFQIVGVVTDTKYRSLREPMQPIVYTPLAHTNEGAIYSAVLLARTDKPANAVIPAIRGELRRLAPEVPISEVSTLHRDLEASLATEKLVSGLAVSFSALAVMIVTVGLFGLLSFVVTQRTREIGIRVAVGAQPGSVVRLVGLRILWLAVAGVAGGLTVAFVAGRVIEPLLYEVPPRDPLAGISAVAVVVLAALVAGAVPTLRALRIDPASALREDG